MGYVVAYQGMGTMEVTCPDVGSGSTVAVMLIAPDGTPLFADDPTITDDGCSFAMNTTQSGVWRYQAEIDTHSHEGSYYVAATEFATEGS